MINVKLGTSYNVLDSEYVGTLLIFVPEIGLKIASLADQFVVISRPKFPNQML